MERTNTALAEASGGAVDHRASVLFFYLLARDHVPAGVLMEVLEEVTEPYTTMKFTNGWLARQAQFLADTLHREDYGCDFETPSGDED